MSKHSVAWLAGDPVSHHLLDLAHDLLEKLKPGIDFLIGDIGWVPWQHDGTPVPDRTLELVKQSECAMVAVTPFGPVSSPAEKVRSVVPGTDDAGSYQDPWMMLSRRLYLHTEIRPCKSFPGNPLNRAESLDIVVFRDLLEGFGAGIGYYPVSQKGMELILSHPAGGYLSIFPPEEIALNSRIVTRQGFEHVVRQAFDFTRRNKRKRITIVDLPEVFPETAEMIVQTAREVAMDFPALPYREESMWSVVANLFRKPEDYDVIVAENLLGDVLSRFAIAEVGGKGFLSRVALNDETAIVGAVLDAEAFNAPPDYVNPFGTLTAVRLVLELLGDVTAAAVLGKAIEQVIQDGETLPPDMGGKSKNVEVCRAVAEKAVTYFELL
jgi:isocitrate/isopropylmalate dehydrogenase